MQYRLNFVRSFGAVVLALLMVILSSQNALGANPADPRLILSYPTDPTANIPWSGGTSGTSSIQAAFNNARTVENTQLRTSIPMLILPSQSEWNQMNDGEKALWLINRERIDRGLIPLHGVETAVLGVAQTYAAFLLSNNAWGHDADGRSPWDRMNAQPAIGACHDFLPIGENLAVYVSSAPGIPLPIERSIYMWIYEDCCSWGHRRAILHYPYSDNSGPVGREGFLGIGRASGGPYKGPFSQSWPYAEIIVMNVFDPCASWQYPPNPSNISISVSVGGVERGSYSLTPGESASANYSGLDSGPVVVKSTTGLPIVVALRDAWAPPGQTSFTSFTQFMGLPKGQLSDTYYFPTYNNVTVNEQVRFANVGTGPTTVTVKIGGMVRGTYGLAAGQQMRVNYPGLDSGPLVVSSSGSVPIVVALRDAWAPPGQTSFTSFTQFMGVPKGQLSDTYYFPAYNNVTVNEQLRFANVGTGPTTVTVKIGGVVRGTYDLAVGQQMRVNYPGLDTGPVVVSSSGSVPIVVALRDAWAPPGQISFTSFTQFMGLPASQLSDAYYFPSYNYVTVNEQVRFANVGTGPTAVTVKIGGVVRGTYNLAAGQQMRVSYPGLDTGPLVVSSSGSVPIVVALRDAWAPPGQASFTSFTQFMGVPKQQLSDTFYLPSYNNITVDEQLRFALLE